MRGRAGRAAFALIELMVVLLAGGALLGVLLVTLNDAFRAQRAALRRLDRGAASAALRTRLVADALAARRYEWRPGVLTLETATRGGLETVTYRIDRERVIRTAAGRQTHRWAAPDLRFAADLQPGPRADVFVLDMEAQRPGPAPARPAQHWPLSIILPTAAPAEERP